MDNFEKQVPLEGDDLKKLKKENKFAVGCAVFVAVIFILPVLWMLTWSFSLPKVLFIFLTLAVGAVAVFIVAEGAIKHRRQVKMDISGGVKRVFISPMESQEMKSRAKRHRGGALAGHETGELVMSYFIKVKGKDYEVPIETYMAIKPGELVEVHLGIHSDVLLRVVKAEQPLPDTATQAPDVGQVGNDSERTS